MKKVFLFKRLGNFLLLMLVPMTVLLILFSVNTGYQITRELESECGQTVSSVDASLGQVIAGAVEQSKSLSANIRMSMALRHALINHDVLYGDILYLDSLQMALYSTVSSCGYLESSYIYLFGGDRVVSSENGLEALASVSDQGWLEVCNSMDESEDSCIRPRIYAEDKVYAHSLLTICQRLLVQNGCIVLNINVDKLQATIDSLKRNAGEVIYIVDTDGRILASSGNSREEYRQLVTGMFEDGMFADGKSGEDGWRKIGRRYFQITTAQMETPSCFILSILPRTVFWSSMAAELARWGLIFAAMAVIIVMLAYYVTSRSFHNINAILDMFDNAERGLPVEGKTDSPKDEYELILNNIVRMFINNSYLKLQLKEKQFKQENAELMALQLQINPHFLYNTLQTLDMEVQKIDRSGSTGLIIRSVSDILKYALAGPGQPVLLEEELEYLKKYARIQEYRFGDFIIYYEVEPDAMEAEVFRLMLQPVVENSLIHGLRNLDRKGYVKVCVQCKGQRLDIRVVDNGRGMSRGELTALREKLEQNEGSSIGLINLNRRLLLRYGPVSCLNVRSKKDWGTVVFFTIPFTKPDSAEPEASN